jgi:predicted transcriptional regulator of viral defense system
MPAATRSLSATEARLVLGWEAEGREEVSLDELETRVGVSRGYARKLAHDLTRKGWLQRTRRGWYLLNPSRRGPEAIPDHDPFRVGSRLAEPYYFAYATAAELWGLLPRAGRTYYIVSPERGHSVARGSTHYRVLHAPRADLFGVQDLVRRGERLRVSDLERTTLDALRHPEYVGGIAAVAGIVASAKPRLRWSRLKGHALRLGNRSLAARLGYLLEHVRPEVRVPRDFLRSLEPPARSPYAPLGSPGEFPRRGPRDERWRLIVNVPERELLGEVNVR